MTLIDSLQLDFGIIEDRRVYLETRRQYWTDTSNDQHISDEMDHAGNCLVFTRGENPDQQIKELLKVYPSAYPRSMEDARTFAE